MACLVMPLSAESRSARPILQFDLDSFNGNYHPPVPLG